ncbi:aminodeoxychorismate synthase component I [Lutibacter sp. HS1-25]|uniref:aminodeoxychorismate synthase component I n=1 Tax=Lutibacter sp. HS1-25 TaxID=2485000 RepID=UPI0010113153|nr:aminodeoxychorismate synthase component I [Lutibacter sp. HS1-25]RXP56611.1 aminodeoxychorismate synthase component I [Lutibacter sp. HS1-25]
MQRTNHKIQVQNIAVFKTQLLIWAQQFKKVVWLDSNNYPLNHSSFDAVLAVDVFSEIETNYFGAFNKLKEYQTRVKDYIFGYLSYDLKNDVEAISSKNFDNLHFPDLYFFQPKKIFFIKGNTVEIKYIIDFQQEIDSDISEINQPTTNNQRPTSNNQVKIKLRIHKDAYFEKINTILNHIHRGDIYEANFCQEFYSKNTTINPLAIYQNLNAISKPPFATFLKINDKFLLSASPERYLKKEGLTIISEPIKGTEKRAETIEEDQQLIKALEKNPKERAENIMIVDLVRNDLSRAAIKGSVKVDELCKVYTFKQVHQLISTISCKVSKNTHPVEIIKNTFPMGSMTGAPKISAMNIMEELEETKRGLYSGAVGYFTPKGDFDFNVIIRSILYNATKKYVSYSVGGAITAQSIPEKEYEECLLKAKAMKQVLLNTN